ncbi:MAG TPA: XRE family transcriptional regulator [Vicinamibacterales bacterium]|jgi:transcriptional regulator with XRE-family HTH domain|nr:XRE family transcriptional regulator [Vicinamibacterales bacterium]
MSAIHAALGRQQARDSSKEPERVFTRASPLTLNELGQRVRAERTRRGLTLGELSARARVSSSMVSAIERGSKAPTVLVLDRLATALDTSLARLMEPETKSSVILLRHDQQAVARDPSGWERRILSPVLPGVEFELMRTTLEPGVDAGLFLPHARGSREYVGVEKGSLVLTLNGVVYVLNAGDSIYYDGNCEHGFKNSRNTPCVYYLAMDVTGDPSGTTHRRAGRR